MWTIGRADPRTHDGAKPQMELLPEEGPPKENPATRAGSEDSLNSRPGADGGGTLVHAGGLHFRIGSWPLKQINMS
jgi:hypothetical protein